jgi:hypothetical protein
MSNSEKRAIWLIVLVVFFAAAYWITGCGSASNYKPQPTPVGKNGKIIIRVGLPQPPPPRSYPLLSTEQITGIPVNQQNVDNNTGRVIPWNTESIKVTLTGDGIRGERIETQNLSESHIVIMEEIPTGLKNLFIELKSGLNGGGDTIAVVRHSVYMSAGSTISLNKSMGVGLISQTEVVPVEIQININSVLFFQKWFCSGDDYRVHLMGPVEKYSPGIRDRTGGDAPPEPYVYYSASIDFDLTGIYSYLAPAHGDARIIVYDPASVRIDSVRGMDETYSTIFYDTTNESSAVYIKINGVGFGNRIMNGGRLRLIDAVTEIEHNQSNFIYTGGNQKWTIDEIQVRVNNLPGGKYIVVLRTNDEDTLYNGHFVKGSGSYQVEIQ